MRHFGLHRKSLFLALIFTFASMVAAQDAPISASPAVSKPTFDVATIKPHEGIVSVVGQINRRDGVSEMAATLSAMIVDAYGVRNEDQVSGGPAWVRSDRYDVEAKLSAEDAPEFQKLSSKEMSERRAQMLRSLLEDRFKLQVHIVTRDVPIYELVVARGGPKMKDAATDTDENLRKGPDGKPVAGVMWFMNGTTAQGYTMGALANMLSQPFTAVGRPVVDKTGLTGTYDFKLDWSAQLKSVLPGAIATLNAPSEDAPSIFTAIQGIGLKLQSATGPEKFIVIDHVERPSAN